jgi:hypothetical protein
VWTASGADNSAVLVVPDVKVRMEAQLSEDLLRQTLPVSWPYFPVGVLVPSGGIYIYICVCVCVCSICVTFRDQNAGRRHSMKVDSSSLDMVEQIEYLGTSLTNKNSIQ